MSARKHPNRMPAATLWWLPAFLSRYVGYLPFTAPSLLALGHTMRCLRFSDAALGPVTALRDRQCAGDCGINALVTELANEIIAIGQIAIHVRPIQGRAGLRTAIGLAGILTCLVLREIYQIFVYIPAQTGNHAGITFFPAALVRPLSVNVTESSGAAVFAFTVTSQSAIYTPSSRPEEGLAMEVILILQ